MTTDPLRELAKLDRELKGLRDRQKALDAEFGDFRARREAAIDARLAELSDELILTDEHVRRWVLDVHGNHTGAYNRVRALAAPTIPEIMVHGVDGREGHDYLLRPTVVLENDSNIAAVAAELARWWTIWGMGRSDLPIDVLESGLSAHGAYTIVWRPDVDRVTLRRMDRAVLRRGWRSEVLSGSLHEVLTYVGKHLPFNHGRDRYDED